MRLLLLSCLWVCVSLWANAAPLTELTLAQIQQRIERNELSLNELKAYYLKRIERIDDHENGLNAVVQINPRLQKQIDALQKKLDNGARPGPLFGAFVLLKDNIDTADGMSNSAGSWLLREHKPTQDAHLVDRIRAADGIILGKANLSEWANFRSTASSSGWSSLWGQTLNPYDKTRSPCGSSSGSAVAIAADLALVSVGTETDGSVTCPAAVNGIVGIKPTLGLVSRSGIIPIAHSQDTAGPMARTLTDAVRLLEAMMGQDNQDTASLPPIKLQQHLKRDGLNGKRIGVIRNLTGYHLGLDQIFEEQLTILSARGAQLIDVTLKTKGQWSEAEYTVLLTEFKAGLNAYLGKSNAPVGSLDELIKLNQQHASRLMPHFKQEIFLAAQKAPSLIDDNYLNALSSSKALTGNQGIDALLATQKLDLLVAPTTAPAWKIDHIIGDHYVGSASSVAAVSGYPHITIPMGRVKHMPVGMSFLGGHLMEGNLIEAAYDFEQSSQARIPPTID